MPLGRPDLALTACSRTPIDFKTYIEVDNLNGYINDPMSPPQNFQRMPIVQNQLVLIKEMSKVTPNVIAI
jgi:hypothetical protein